MGWQTGLLEATEDLEITQEEITSLVESVVSAAIQGMIILGMVTMFVKGFYGILGEEKYKKEEKEILKMAEEIW